MDSTRGVVSVARPAYWDEVVEYAAGRGPDLEANAKIRPPVAHARQALAELLDKSRLGNARVNEGYLRALGLHP